MESQNLDNNNSNQPEAEYSDPQKPRENKMVSEGALTSVQYYNEHDGEEEDENTKLSSNDTSPEKSENTETIAPENRINTRNI